MTNQTNRDKNTAHDQRRASKVRPSAPSYNFKDLERVVRGWVTGSTTPQEEIYSPYYGA